MLETVSKGRPGAGRPPARLPNTKRAEKIPDAGLKLQDVLDAQRERQLHDELIIQSQREQYDFQAAERAELDREYDSTRDLMLEQMKRDDETLKKYISLI